jgi:hypothetical protein
MLKGANSSTLEIKNETDFKINYRVAALQNTKML